MAYNDFTEMPVWRKAFRFYDKKYRNYQKIKMEYMSGKKSLQEIFSLYLIAYFNWYTGNIR